LGEFLNSDNMSIIGEPIDRWLDMIDPPLAVESDRDILDESCLTLGRLVEWNLDAADY